LSESVLFLQYVSKVKESFCCVHGEISCLWCLQTEYFVAVV